MILTEFDEKKYKKMFYRDGVQDGIEQGIQQGIQQGISVLIDVQQEQGRTFEDTEKLIKDKYSLDEDEARMYMTKWWSKK